MRFFLSPFWCVALLLPAMGFGLRAAEGERFAAVVARTPALQSARLRIDAARARLGAVGKFPDPRLEGMGSRVSNSMQGSWPKWELGLQQPLPKAGERAAQRERALAAVAMAEADFGVMAGELAADTAMAIAEADAASDKAALLDAQVVRIGQILASLDARVAAGQGRAADRLAMQSRAAAMRLMAEKEKRMAADILGAARGALGIAENQPLPGFARPPADSLGRAGSPAARLADAKSAEAVAMAKMARASGNPMTSVGLRVSREQMPMESEDMVGIVIMMDIPWNAKSAARAEETAAMNEAAAGRAERGVAEMRVAAAQARLARAKRLAETARRLAGETSARLDAEYAGLLGSSSAAGAGMANESTLPMLLEILEKQTDAKVQVIEAEAAERIAAAALWKHAAPAIFPMK